MVVEWSWGGKGKRDERRVVKLFDQAQQQRVAGRLGEAAQTLNAVLDLTRGLAKQYPEVLTHQQAIASALYMLAAVHQAAGRPDAAIAVLSECEGIYERLGQARFLNARPLIADVKIRRAGALADQGLGASAVVEADAAVATYLQITGGGADEKQRPDLARVLAPQQYDPGAVRRS
jgi:hypothetical protein